MIIFIEENHIKTKQTSGNHCRKKFKPRGSRAIQATKNVVIKNIVVLLAIGFKNVINPKIDLKKLIY